MFYNLHANMQSFICSHTCMKSSFHVFMSVRYICLFICHCRWGVLEKFKKNAYYKKLCRNFKKFCTKLPCLFIPVFHKFLKYICIVLQRSLCNFYIYSYAHTTNNSFTYYFTTGFLTIIYAYSFFHPLLNLFQ